MKLMNALWGRFLAFRERHPRLTAWLGRYGIYLLVLSFILLDNKHNPGSAAERAAVDLGRAQPGFRQRPVVAGRR